MLMEPGIIWLQVPQVAPLVMVVKEVNRVVLGVPLCMWRISPCTFRYIPAGHAHLMKQINTCMSREPLAACMHGRHT